MKRSLQLLFVLSLLLQTSIHAQSFSTLWSQSIDLSIDYDVAKGIASDASGVYIIGDDYSTGDRQWRIEKRDLITGALITSFGIGGAVLSNPSVTYDYPTAIAIDTSGIYIAGTAGLPNYLWWIEKRNLTTGALITSFGTGGAVSSNPSSLSDEPHSIKADTSGIYIVGYDGSSSNNNQWHIEKRSLTTGALIPTFGVNGIQVSNPTITAHESAWGVAVDATGLYIVGEQGPGLYKWRIEKRELDNANPVLNFGSNGVVVIDPTSTNDYAYTVTAHSSGIFVAGTAAGAWRIEKRDATTGALITGFGTGGIVASDPSNGIEAPHAIVADANALYIAGYDQVPGNNQWRVEKRDLNTGALLCTYSNNFSSGNDMLYSLCLDASGIYLAGFDETIGSFDMQWRIEKIDLCGIVSGDNTPVTLQFEFVSATIFSSGEDLEGTLVLPDAGTYTVELVDIQGRKVIDAGTKQGQRGNNVVKLDLSNLNAAMYFVKITDSKGEQLVKRIVIN